MAASADARYEARAPGPPPGVCERTQLLATLILQVFTVSILNYFVTTNFGTRASCTRAHWSEILAMPLISITSQCVPASGRLLPRYHPGVVDGAEEMACVNRYAELVQQVISIM